jgi:hypothetical protein
MAIAWAGFTQTADLALGPLQDNGEWTETMAVSDAGAYEASGSLLYLPMIVFD